MIRSTEERHLTMWKGPIPSGRGQIPVWRIELHFQQVLKNEDLARWGCGKSWVLLSLELFALQAQFLA
jgi:hypothetical protein